MEQQESGVSDLESLSGATTPLRPAFPPIKKERLADGSEVSSESSSSLLLSCLRLIFSSPPCRPLSKPAAALCCVRSICGQEHYSLNGPGLDERSFLDYPKGKQIELTVLGKAFKANLNCNMLSILDSGFSSLIAQVRKIPVPSHRYTPLKENWMKIFEPIVEHLKLQVRPAVENRFVTSCSSQVRFNLKTRNVEVRTCKDTADATTLQKAADFVRAFVLGFEVGNRLSSPRSFFSSICFFFPFHSLSFPISSPPRWRTRWPWSGSTTFSSTASRSRT